MEREYTFEFDERVDYAFDCLEVLYAFLEMHTDLFAQQCDCRLLEYKLRTKTLAKEDMELALGCIERKIDYSMRI